MQSCGLSWVKTQPRTRSPCRALISETEVRLPAQGKSEEPLWGEDVDLFAHQVHGRRGSNDALRLLTRPMLVGSTGDECFDEGTIFRSLVQENGPGFRFRLHLPTGHQCSLSDGDERRMRNVRLRALNASRVPSMLFQGRVVEVDHPSLIQLAAHPQLAAALANLDSTGRRWFDAHPGALRLLDQKWLEPGVMETLLLDEGVPLLDGLERLDALWNFIEGTSLYDRWNAARSAIPILFEQMTAEKWNVLLNPSVEEALQRGILAYIYPTASLLATGLSDWSGTRTPQISILDWSAEDVMLFEELWQEIKRRLPKDKQINDLANLLSLLANKNDASLGLDGLVNLVLREEPWKGKDSFEEFLAESLSGDLRSRAMRESLTAYPESLRRWTLDQLIAIPDLLAKTQDRRAFVGPTEEEFNWRDPMTIKNLLAQRASYLQQVYRELWSTNLSSPGVSQSDGIRKVFQEIYSQPELLLATKLLPTQNLSQWKNLISRALSRR